MYWCDQLSKSVGEKKEKVMDFMFVFTQKIYTPSNGDLPSFLILKYMCITCSLTIDFLLYFPFVVCIYECLQTYAYLQHMHEYITDTLLHNAIQNVKTNENKQIYIPNKNLCFHS